MHDEKPPPDRLPDDDILYGLKAIAKVYGISHDAARMRHFHGHLPTFNIGRTVCARRSTIAADIAAREAAARAAHGSED